MLLNKLGRSDAAVVYLPRIASQANLLLARYLNIRPLRRAPGSREPSYLEFIDV